MAGDSNPPRPDDETANAVGIYDRPHPLARPRAWVPMVLIAVALIVIVGWWLVRP